MKRYFFFFLFSFSLVANELPDFTINLKMPEYKNGTISTNEGGVIASDDLWIQAKNLFYTNNGNTHQVIAEGNLLIDRNGRVYVGKRLEYDFIKRKGVVIDGITAVDLWFLGGTKIELNSDKSFSLYNAFLTTSENKKANWEITSPKLNISKNNYLNAENVAFRFLDTPIFWLPSFKSNLKSLADSPVRYRVDYDKGLIPRLSMRYRIYSSELLHLFLRLNLRLPKRGGSSFESIYHSRHKRSKMLTRSYIDHEPFYRDETPRKSITHYRLQGSYEAHSENDLTHLYISYDYLSDKAMQTDFKSDNFELNTAKQTMLKLRHQENTSTFGVNGRFRINSFEGLKQELPSVFLNVKPFNLGNFGLIAKHDFKAAYLDYVTASDLKTPYNNFHAARVGVSNEFYRPFHIKGISIIPLVGMKGIFYSNTPKNRAATQAFFNYDLFLNSSFKRSYSRISHVIKPYLHYKGLSKPKLSPNEPFIFDINDGYSHTNLLTGGVSNLFYLKKLPLFDPNFIIDFSAYSFFNTKTFTQTIPKIQGGLTWNFPSFSFHTKMGWNVENQFIDYANVGIAWTINKNFAFKSEFRHRGPFYWKRSDPGNFMMEGIRSIDILLASPLSDQRKSVISCLQMNIAPQWTARLESLIGWRRTNEPIYSKIKLDLLTVISTSWHLRLSFGYSPSPTESNNKFPSSLLRHFSCGLSLTKD